MKKMGIVLTAICIVFILHFNLPPNDIKNHISLPEDSGFLMEMAAITLLSETVAKWHYYNFFIIKFAHSERFDLLVVGLPFCKWFPLSENNS